MGWIKKTKWFRLDKNLLVGITCTIDLFSAKGLSSESEEKRLDATSDKYSLDQYTDKT